MKRFVTVVACGAVLFIGAGSGVQSAGKRLVKVDDLFEIRDVADPQISPDGDWVAYTVRQPDPKTDKNETDIYMTRWDGSQTIRLTTSKGAETTPRFSPDGRFIAFLSDRDYDEETDQVWLLNRAGGEAERITEFKGGVLDIAWSPDGKKLALVVTDPDPNVCDPEKEGGKEACEEKTPKPIVIDRYRFKLDETGYLGKQHDHLFLLDVSTRKSEQITSGQYDDEMPSWSPDGRSIAFVSKRADKDPDRGDNYDVYVLEAKA